MKLSLKFLLQKTALASAFSLLCTAPFGAYAEEADNKLLTDRIIVKYKESAKVGRAATMAQETVEKASRRAGHKMHHLRRIATGAQVMRLEGRKNRAEVNAIIDRLRQDPDVEYAEPDLILKAVAVPNDPSYLNQWHYYESTGGLNLPSAWDTTAGNGAVVAVLDTGYRPHADLAANILPGYDMIDDTFVSVDGDGRDSDATDPGDWYSSGTCGDSSSSNSSWHGTHVAGTIAGVTNNNLGIAGVAYEAKIVPVRVLGRCGGYTSDIADGIIWGAGGSVSGLPANANPADVLNLSLGGSGSCGTTTQNAIDTARSLGATVVVAAGNSNANASQFTPASCDGVISVAATNRSGGRAYYSNYGNVVDVAAPGGAQSFANDSDGVLSTYNNGATDPGSDSYYYIQGTSMAAPHVAGAAALLYSVDPTLTPDEVESILTSTARSFPASCSSCGSGIVDAAAAVALANGGGGGGGGNDGGELENGVAETGIEGNSGDEINFTLEVPNNATDLSFVMSGGSGDADLYVRHGSAPTTSTYDCRPYTSGNNETCDIDNVQGGTYHVMVRGYSSFSNVSLVGSYTAGGGGGGGSDSWEETNLSGSRNSWQHFTIDVDSGASTLSAVMSGGSGDADLYVRFGQEPTRTAYDCRPYEWGNDESCSISNPDAGTWYISIRGYSDYSGVSLSASTE
ncbi:S8 family peptidase [Microbulbifer sp. VAAF005]|uniref:S8 family peptidase n=1 Tax=Microbulbifer sp. VAAF005 TaxID=3034230 RepID=UPI0024AD2A2D|nr:S8 family peptidase [Microbulbifer sp. VAAF005]WHI47217.1 S8 family serine peptidase [Microbulbifer sp. VAAF005]